MATKTDKKNKGATNKTAGMTAPKQGDVTPRPNVNAHDLAGTPGPGPKVGDSAFQSPVEDHVSKGRPVSDSDGTNAGSLAPTGEKKAKTGSIQKTFTAMPVVYMTHGRNPGKARPALVMRPTDPNLENAERSPIDLVAFPDSGKYPNNDHLPQVVHAEGVFYDEGLMPGTWHKPEDTDALLLKKEKSEATELDKKAVASNAARAFGR